MRVPRVTYTGNYVVNTNVRQGTYKATGVEHCYWERSTRPARSTTTTFVEVSPQVLVTFLESDYALNNDCGVPIEVLS
jgi:hypothetical protein